MIHPQLTLEIPAADLPDGGCFRYINRLEVSAGIIEQRRRSGVNGMTKWRTRLYLDTFDDGSEIMLNSSQSHLLRSVLRCQTGESLRIFNGEKGEYAATISAIHKKYVAINCEEKLREAEPASGIAVAFAPIKRIDYVVQKAVEMGASSLQPVITERTQGGRFALERMQANIIEAAEQSERVSLPMGHSPLGLENFLAHHPADRPLLFCDETRCAEPPQLGFFRGVGTLLIGPEGGFTQNERDRIYGHSATQPLSLGPHILRTDTAVVAALAMVHYASTLD